MHKILIGARRLFAGTVSIFKSTVNWAKSGNSLALWFLVCILTVYGVFFKCGPLSTVALFFLSVPFMAGFLLQKEGRPALFKPYADVLSGLATWVTAASLLVVAYGSGSYINDVVKQHPLTLYGLIALAFLFIGSLKLSVSVCECWLDYKKRRRQKESLSATCSKGTVSNPPL